MDAKTEILVGKRVAQILGGIIVAIACAVAYLVTAFHAVEAATADNERQDLEIKELKSEFSEETQQIKEGVNKLIVDQALTNMRSENQGKQLTALGADIKEIKTALNKLAKE